MATSIIQNKNATVLNLHDEFVAYSNIANGNLVFIVKDNMVTMRGWVRLNSSVPAYGTLFTSTSVKIAEGTQAVFISESTGKAYPVAIEAGDVNGHDGLRIRPQASIPASENLDFFSGIILLK